MTDEERQHLQDMKSDASARLAGLVGDGTHRRVLDGTDSRIWQYCESVVRDPAGHNLYEVLAVVRFFDLLSRYRWSPGRVRHFFRFYESLRFNGSSGRTRYRLTPVQAFQFASVFGFYRPDGQRLTRLVYLFVPRKYGKTTSVASLAVYDLLFGDSNAQAYVAANSYNQAKICFDEIRAIMRDLDPAEKHFRVNREAIFFKGNARDSLVRCLSANPKTLDGLNASLVIMDEYAQARDTATKSGAELKNVLTSSMGARRNPLTVIMTTASDVIEGPFRHELAGVTDVLQGKRDADTMFASLFMPDAGDEDGDPRTWAKVQPHLGVTVRPDFYAREWESAQLSAESMLAFRTKLLNVFAVNETKTWFTPSSARRLLGDFDFDVVGKGLRCAVAFDLSVRDDFSAVSYTVFNGADRRFYCHTDYYFPREALAGHPNEQLYRRWHTDGHLTLCEGNRIDVRRIADDIIARCRNVDVAGIGFDSYKAQYLRNILESAGGQDVLMPYPQTNGSFNLPTETFEMMAYAAPPSIVLNDNPINAYCLANCVIETDRMENKKPFKQSQYQKIDGAITMLMTIGILYQARA